MRRRYEGAPKSLGRRTRWVMVVWPQPPLRLARGLADCLLVRRSRRLDLKKWYLRSEKHCKVLKVRCRGDFHRLQHHRVHHFLESFKRILIQFSLHVQPTQWRAQLKLHVRVHLCWLLHLRNGKKNHLPLLIIGICFGLRLLGNYEVFEVFWANGSKEKAESLILEKNWKDNYKSENKSRPWI